MRFLFFTILILLILAAPVAAQNDDVTTLTDQFDTLVPTLLKQAHVPGASLALIHNNEVVWSQGYGLADEDYNTTVTADTVFSVESISKALTAWEIMRLVEAGKIDLDAPVNQYLKSWQLTGLGNKDPDQATIRRILSHTAGLSVDGYRGFNADTTYLPPLPDFLDGKAGGAQPVQVMITPGRRFMYSGGGYTVLQLMIEDITGEAFQDVMKTDVLDRLGMTRSFFQWPAGLPDRATSYTTSGNVDSDLIHEDQAAGGLFTSANDLARFFTQGMTGDWLTPESVALMHTAAEATEGEYGFGNFLFSLDGGIPVVWHDGIGFGQRSIFFLLPRHGDGLIILTNKGNGNRIFKQIVCAWDFWLHGDATTLCQDY
ncbi:MAG: serine hydrolase domain-containing protein [Chloroflexota bacterium]